MVQAVSPMKKLIPIKHHVETRVALPVIIDVSEDKIDEVSKAEIASPNKGVKRKIEDETPMEEAIIET